MISRAPIYVKADHGLLLPLMVQLTLIYPKDPSVSTFWIHPGARVSDGGSTIVEFNKWVSLLVLKRP